MVQLLNIAGALQPLDLGQTFDQIDRSRGNPSGLINKEKALLAAELAGRASRTGSSNA